MRRRAVAPLIVLALASAAKAQAPRPSAFPGEAPPSPPAEILVFRAEPDANDAGRAVRLRWEAVNAYELAISPDIGPVPTFGTRRVAPPVATTYTLSVTGAGGTVTAAVTVEGIEAVGGVEGVEAARRTASAGAGESGLARLPDGTVDLSGVFIGGRDIHLQGSVELTPPARAAAAAAARNADDLGQGVLCVPPGVPNATLMPFPLQLVHKDDLLVILYEAYHLFRIVPIGRDHPAYLDPTWMGSSVAHWEDDTLVVVVKGFNDKTRIAGNTHTTDMVVTERYTRLSPQTIRYEAVIDDPAVFAEPVRYAGNLTARPEWEIGEYVCAENNKDYDALFEVR